MAFAKKAVQAEDPKPFSGFLPDGTFARSENPFHNRTHQFVRRAITMVAVDYLTPEMFISALRQEPAEITGLFPGWLIAQWFSLDRYNLWPLAASCSTLTQVIKMQGKASAPWFDENSWTRACDIAERRHGHESRLVDVRENLESLLTRIGQ